MDSFSSGFRQCGHQVLEIDTSQGFNNEDYKKVKDFKPCYIVCYGFAGILSTPNGALFRLMGIPMIALLYDNPFFLLSDTVEEELREYADYYHLFIWDSYFLKKMRENRYKNCFSIMLAADLGKFYPQKVEVVPNSLAFVGSIKLPDNKCLDGLPSLVKNFIETIIEYKIQHFDVPVMEICSYFMNQNSYTQIREIFQNQVNYFWKTIYYKIHSVGSSYLRYFVLNCIEDVDINIYGSGKWENKNVRFHEYVPYGPSLSREYQKHVINLNISSIQLEHSINNRVFDVFASKSFLLRDYKEDMKKVFPQYWSYITFSNLSELGEKGEYYLTHEKERIELVEEIYNHIIKNHTYKERVKQILSIINEKNPCE